jgi:putative methylase
MNILVHLRRFVTLMKKRRLEIALQKLRAIERKSPSLEQYQTPAAVASDVLWEAFSAGDIAGKSVADLGCGNGIFCIGSKLLGAASSFGMDVDREAIQIAAANAGALGLEVELVEGNVSSLNRNFDTVVQNPPFGAQTRHADRKFILKALEAAPRVYSLHNDGTQGFVERMVEGTGGHCEAIKRYKFEIPYAFEFHRKASETVPVVLLRYAR